MTSKQFYQTTAWKWFSKYIILNHSFVSNGSHFAKCATSGRIYELPDKRIHAGHWIKVFDGNSTNFSTAFDEHNCLPQSSHENVYKGGNPYEMSLKIESLYGAKAIEQLHIKKNNICKLDKFTLDLIAKEYRLKFNELAKEKGNPWK